MLHFLVATKCLAFYTFEEGSNVKQAASKFVLHSCKLTWHWKFSFSTGNTSSKGPFSIAIVDYQRLICFGKTFEDGQGKDQNMVPKKKMEGFCFHSLMHYDALLGHTLGKQAV